MHIQQDDPSSWDDIPYVGDCVDCPRNTISSKPGSLSCEECPEGYFTEDTGATECVPCAPGSYVKGSYESGELVHVCTPCEAGYYNPSPSQPSCQKCPFSYWSDPGASTCFRCPAGYYTPSEGYDMGKCMQCPPLTYTDEPGHSGLSCKPCPAGFATAGKGSTACTTCPAGTYVYKGSTYDSDYGTCKRCPKNTYNAKPGMDKPECTRCPDGHTSTEGASACTICPAGSFVNTQNVYYNNAGTCELCPRNTFNAEPGLSGASCSPCPAGHVAPEGATACVPCPAGSSIDADGRCKTCPSGTYASEPSAPTCAACPAGSISKPGSTSADACKQCRAGTYITESLDGSLVCTACPEDSYSDAPGSTECKRCPERHIAPQGSTSQGQCQLCPAGKYYKVFDDGSVSDECDVCPQNTFSATAGLVAEACEPCPPGHTAAPGSTTCMPCAAGSFVDPSKPPEQRQCEPCPKGYHSPKEASTQCTACPLGSSTAGGETECTPCGPGESGKLELDGTPVCIGCNALGSAGALVCPTGQGRVLGCHKTDPCEQCPAGTHAAPNSIFTVDACIPCPRGSTALAGSAACAACALGTSTAELGGAACTPCERGWYGAGAVSGTGPAAVPVALCQPCPPGTYNEAERETTCMACPAGKTHFMQGSGEAADCRLAYTEGMTRTFAESITRMATTIINGPGPTLTFQSKKTTPGRRLQVTSGSAVTVPAAEQAYTTVAESRTGGELVPRPLDPPERTGVVGYTVFWLEGGTVVASVESEEAQFQTCTAKPPPANMVNPLPRIVLECVRKVAHYVRVGQDGSSSSFDEEETLTLEEVVEAAGGRR